MMPAAKHGDPQLGVDIHLCVVPPSPSPVPLPTPHISVVFDPFDYVPILGATVTVCGMKCATAGTGGIAVHIPPGFPFAPKLPDWDDELFMGSSTVIADANPFSYIALPVLSCQIAGMMAPPRPKKKGPLKMMVLPLTFNLAIPTGVFVGGAPTVSLMGLAFRGAFAALGKLAKSGLFKRIRQKVFKNMKPGFLKCKVLRAEPVNILTGEVSVEQEDFTLPGRIPIEWVRSYSSGSRRPGVCGVGWETPADARLEIDPADGGVTLQYPGVGPLFFARLPAAEGDEAAELELMDGARLTDHGDEYWVRTKDDRIYHFPKGLVCDGLDGTREIALGRISDLCGNWLELERHAGRFVGIQESAGRRIVAVLENGRIAELSFYAPGTDTRHPFVRYEYAATGDLVAVIDALGNPYRFAYEDHHLSRHTNRTGLSFYYEYDKEPLDGWRVVHSWGDGGLYDYQFAYDDLLNERRITDSRDHVWLVKLDARGLPISEIDPLGGMTVFEYDDAGRTTAVVNPGGQRTEYQYDDCGNLLKLTRPDGTNLSAEYGPDHHVTALVEPGGRVMRFAHQRGCLIERVSPRGGRWRYEYNTHGDLVAAFDPDGAWTRWENDAFGNVVASHSSSGARIRLDRDALGNILTRWTSDGQRSTYHYDQKRRVVAVRHADGSTIACAYDPADNLVAYTDELGGTVRLKYAGLGQVIERIAADGTSVRYEYDTEEWLSTVVNERGDAHRFERDPLGRVTRELDYWRQSRSYDYDAAGRLAAATNALGECVETRYDEMDRPVRRVLPTGAVETFEYDSSGKLIIATGPGGRVERSYDDDGNLTREVTNGLTVRSEYNLAGRRVSRSSSLGNTLRIAYDDAGRLGELTLNERSLARLQYDSTGRLKGEWLGAHLHRDYEYGSRGHLTQQTLRRGRVTIADQRFRYDAAGQLIERVGPNGDQAAIDYDPVGRVRRFASAAHGVQELAYDAAGDLLKPANTSLGPTEIRSARHEDITYVYDAAGRLSRRERGTEQARFRWDALDRLVGCTNESGQRIEFEYDPLGRRTLKRVDDGTVRFLWDEHHLAGEQSEGESHEFIFRPYTFEPLAVINGAVGYYETDPTALPHALFAEDGSVIWQGHYNALGRLVDAPIDDAAQPLRLQGQYFDDETGLAYNRFRYYDGHSGSFVSQDPLGQRAGTNLYSYGPNVWGWADVFGLTCKTTTVYRVEGPGNARVHIDASGNVKIPTKDSFLYVSFRDQAHADYFLAKKRAEFPDSTIKAFDVPEDVVNDIQRRAVPQRQGRQFPGAPQISDPTVAKQLGMDPRDVLGVKGSDIGALEEHAIPGSGRTL